MENATPQNQGAGIPIALLKQANGNPVCRAAILLER
jgi:hypothetical protein